MSAWLDKQRDVEVTLEELIATARRLVQQCGARPDDGRVGEQLDARTARYYQTLGLLDKPIRFDGRRAMYGFRHLLQLACIKCLQADGYPLALVQQTLAGHSTSQLEASLRSKLSLPPQPVPDPSARQLVAAELTPGVTLTIDPQRIADPHALLSRITAALFEEKR